MPSALAASSSLSDDGGTIDVVAHVPALSPPQDVRVSDGSSEFAYRRGRHTVPMHSPGDDLLADQHLPSSAMPRLPRLRNRVFFQSDADGNDDTDVTEDDDAAVDAGAAAAIGEESAPLGTRRRVLFRRRRKRQEGDAFWTAIFVANVLSLAVLACLVVYLTQTDFFASHQNDLFGTTVDNRFTVVSQQDARAKIYLKSGAETRRFVGSSCSHADHSLLASWWCACSLLDPLPHRLLKLTVLGGHDRVRRRCFAAWATGTDVHRRPALLRPLARTQWLGNVHQQSHRCFVWSRGNETNEDMN